jgi:hypothetical protein
VPPIPTGRPLYAGIAAVLLPAVFITVTCTPPPPPPAVHECPKPPWQEYAPYSPLQVSEEITRLQIRLAQGDTLKPFPAGAAADSSDSTAQKKPTALDIWQRLFELSVHHANPAYNLDTILSLATFLSGRSGPDSLRYLDWIRIVREQKTLFAARDSLDAVLAEQKKKESTSVESLRRDLKNGLRQRDSLSAVILRQQEKIENLQKIDVLMEQQRRKN